MTLRKFALAILLITLISGCIKEINITYIINTNALDTNLLKKIPRGQVPKDDTAREIKQL